LEIRTEEIVRLLSYFSLIHHVKGRIRLRVNPKIKEHGKGWKIEDIEQLAQKITGITRVKINKIVASITIEYDANILPMHLWEDLTQGTNTQEVTQRINAAYKEIQQ